jgi:hypothetical protein
MRAAGMQPLTKEIWAMAGNIYCTVEKMRNLTEEMGLVTQKIGTITDEMTVMMEEIRAMEEDHLR